MKQVILSIFLLILFQGQALAKTLRIATWNFEKASLERIDTLGAAHFSKAGQAIKADILLVQELTSYAAARRMAQHMGYRQPHVVVTDFNRDQNQWFKALELGIISRIPIKSVSEFDLTPDGLGVTYVGPSGHPVRIKESEFEANVPEKLFKKSETFPDDRGILRVELVNGLILYNVHLTSNYPEYCVKLANSEKELEALKQVEKKGKISPQNTLKLRYLKAVVSQKDHLSSPKNPEAKQHWYRVARKREQIAAILAKLVARDVKAGRTVLAAGDFNTSAEEPCRAGKKLEEDADLAIGCGTYTVPNSCGQTDGFDDTLAVLTEGIVDGLKMKPLSYGLGRTQHGRNEEKYPNAPIDHIFVAGPGAEQFSNAVKVDDKNHDRKVFESDHNPLVTTVNIP